MWVIIIIIVIGAFIGLSVVAHKRSKRLRDNLQNDYDSMPEEENTRNVRFPPPLPKQAVPALPQNKSGKRRQLPSLPHVTATSTTAKGDPLLFPRCPVDRVHNTKGGKQKVFWSQERKEYYCCYGHFFK